MRKQMNEVRQMVANVENFKRRRALPHFGNEQQFFDRVLEMKKLQELVFITKAVAKTR